MSYFLTNAITKFRHKGRKDELEICQYCGLMIINATPFPFGMCTGTSNNPHKPVTSRKA